MVYHGLRFAAGHVTFHIPKGIGLLGLLALVATTGACQLQKSEHPLSPTVAGPIPGVDITTPSVIEPRSGTRIPAANQPVTLTVDNATTSGVRPLSYLFEVASDVAFSSKVLSRDNVPPGQGGRTSLRLPQALATGRTYYWRVRAQDGANTGTFTPPTLFEVYTPVVIQAAVPISPIGGVTVTTLAPALSFQNAPSTGNGATLEYYVAVSEDDSFGTMTGVWSVSQQQQGVTSFQVPFGVLQLGRLYFWMVRGYDGISVGPWSTVQSFRTPASGNPGGGGGTATDFDSLGPVQIVGGSPDIRSWAVTSRITSMVFSPGNLHLEHTRFGQWPAVDTGGGGLQEATLWVFFRISGQWYATGGDRLRPGDRDRELTNPSAIGPGWFYSPMWSPMSGYVPRPGELVGFMVVAGSTRADFNVAVRERSNVLLIPFPADGIITTFP
jgi:hypothetical protein